MVCAEAYLRYAKFHTAGTLNEDVWSGEWRVSDDTQSERLRWRTTLHYNPHNLETRIFVGTRDTLEKTFNYLGLERRGLWAGRQTEGELCFVANANLLAG